MNIFFLATNKEAYYIRRGANVINKYKCPGFDIFELEKNKKHIGLVITNIGKVHAGAALVAAINVFGRNNNFFNVGTSGSLDKNVADILGIVIGTSFVQYDIDTTPIGDPLGMVSGPNMVYFPSSDKLNKLIEKGCNKLNKPYSYGIISTGDKFIASKEDKDFIKSKFNSLVIEMEAAAIAEMAHAYKVNFSSFKVITDVNDESEYFANFKPAVKLVGELVWAM